MQNTKLFITTLFLAIMLTTKGLFAQFAGGTGTESDPYQISTPEHLNNVRNYLGNANAGKYFKMMNDIDLTAYLAEGGAGYAAWGTAGWLPIGGSYPNHFSGYFNGYNHKISGLKIDRSTTDYVGLFSILGDRAILQNIGIVISDENSVNGKSSTGGLVGENDGTILNCHVAGTVIGVDYVGGLVGVNGGSYINEGGFTCDVRGQVISSFSCGSVSGVNYIGGLVGMHWLGNILNCYSNSNVAGNYVVGGLLGQNGFSSFVRWSYATGNVTGVFDVGGLLGAGGHEDYIIKSYWDKESTGQLHSSGSDDSFGKTTIAMKTQSTYTGWDFVGETINGTNDYWGINSEINNGYPHFANPYIVGIQTPLTSKSTVILSNYPNPFNPTTTINYELQKSTIANLSIYNAKGELVKTLINGMQPAGKHSINFNGSSLNSGVYFYKLQAEGKTMVNKMILCK